MMDASIQNRLDSIISEVKKKTGINIDTLKPAFLERRVQYRMRILGIPSFDGYLKVLSTETTEAKDLYKSFSINVTKFFRDPHVWDTISCDILTLLDSQIRFSPIRAWSCGCASGEEPYSISIMLANFLKNKKYSYDVFATDISLDALEFAKNGIYREENLVNVKPEVKSEHFEKTPENTYKIHSKAKNQVQFFRLDMLKNSGKLFDIIFCRNVLIYYDKNGHEQIFKKFHESLKKDGFLVIGQDESMIGTEASKLFDLVLPKERIYKKMS